MWLRFGPVYCCCHFPLLDFYTLNAHSVQSGTVLQFSQSVFFRTSSFDRLAHLHIGCCLFDTQRLHFTDLDTHLPVRREIRLGIECNFGQVALRWEQLVSANSSSGCVELGVFAFRFFFSVQFLW